MSSFLGYDLGFPRGSLVLGVDLLAGCGLFSVMSWLGVEIGWVFWLEEFLEFSVGLEVLSLALIACF